MARQTRSTVRGIRPCIGASSERWSSFSARAAEARGRESVIRWIPACSMGVAEDAGTGDSTLTTKFLEQRRHDFLLLLHQLLTSPSPHLHTLSRASFVCCSRYPIFSCRVLVFCSNHITMLSQRLARGVSEYATAPTASRASY